jgi:hypothetical protein
VPLPAKELWRRISTEITGQPESRQIAILQRHLADWPMDFKGPYQVLRAKLEDLLSDLERVQAAVPIPSAYGLQARDRSRWLG